MKITSVCKKAIMAVTGLALIVFLCGHLAGNLLLFCGPESFNGYAHKLIKLGPLLYVVEAGLLLFFLLHAVSGISVWLKKKKAKPQDYEVAGRAGGTSRKTVASMTMIVSGMTLLAFMVVHLKTLKFGPGVAEGYVVDLHGEQVRDLYKLVLEAFSSPVYTGFYVICMILLGFHLRHAFWSAFQSLGVGGKKLTPALFGLGVVVALLLGAGFVVLPIWLYVKGGSL